MNTEGRHGPKPIRKSSDDAEDVTSGHRRIGHLNWEEYFTPGQHWKGNQPREVYDPCQLAAGLYQASRQSHTREETPFDRVYYDLI